MFRTFASFFQRSQKPRRGWPTAQRRGRFPAGFKLGVEALEQRAMLSASLLSFTGPTYSQNFDSLPNAGADQTAISAFTSSGPFDAISPTSGSTIDTGANSQGLGASGMA